MAKTDSPNNSPEEVENIQIELATLAYFLYTTPQAKHLLFEAKAGRITKHDCMMRLKQLGAPFP
uniref:hypothetical protein n=1 Tax=Sedimenticola sp. TaxID=1940285 RepID=UPI003D137980